MKQHNSSIDCSVSLISEPLDAIVDGHSLDTVLASKSAEPGVINFERLLSSPHKPEMTVSLYEAFLDDLANHWRGVRVGSLRVIFTYNATNNINEELLIPSPNHVINCLVTTLPAPGGPTFLYFVVSNP